MILELMNNTKHHAYDDGKHFHNWYLYVRFIRGTNTMQFLFFDNGSGIPATIQKTKMEMLQEWVSMGGNLFFNNCLAIEAALAGAFRSRTGLAYRNKGLPMIRELAELKYIQNMHIVSNFANFRIDSHQEMKVALSGTLFYWEMHEEALA
jgi:hypothetical protein